MTPPESTATVCPVTVDPTTADPAPPVDVDQAATFLQECWAELAPDADPAPRLQEMRADVDRTGTYTHRPDELEWAARRAWANSDRCIATFRYRSLRVRDQRHQHTTAGVVAAAVEHLRVATNGGRIRPTMTVLPPIPPGGHGLRIWNTQTVSYFGDPKFARLAEVACLLGHPAPDSPWQLLPLIVQDGPGRPDLYDIPGDAVLEVPLSHPHYPWFADLGLRWYALPAITGQRLEAGGIHYPCIFAGWYAEVEVMVDLASPDRFDLAPTIARQLGLDPGQEWTDYRGAAATALNQAILHSFRATGVTIASHHTESALLRSYLDREIQQHRGSRENVDWTWVNLPSAMPTDLYSRYYRHDPGQTPRLVWPPAPAAVT